MRGQLVTETRMRAGIARRMTESKLSVPHFYVGAELRLDGILATLEELNQALPSDERITLTTAIVRATASALVEQPRFNAIWTEDGLLQSDEVNVGVAVSLDEGLIAPALRNADELTLRETAVSLRDLVTRARASRLRPAELTDGTFTVSNLGMFQVSAFTAIITPPQVAILAAARQREELAVQDGDVSTTRVMTVTLSADHRAVDGADAARFLESLKRAIEEPTALLLPARARVGTPG